MFEDPSSPQAIVRALQGRQMALQLDPFGNTIQGKDQARVPIQPRVPVPIDTQNPLPGQPRVPSDTFSTSGLPHSAMMLPPGVNDDIPSPDAPGLFQQPFGTGGGYPGKAPEIYTRDLGAGNRSNVTPLMRPANVNDPLIQRLQEGRPDVHSGELLGKPFIPGPKMGSKITKDPNSNTWTYDPGSSQSLDEMKYENAVLKQRGDARLKEYDAAIREARKQQILKDTARKVGGTQLPSSADQLRAWMQELGIPDPTIK